MDTQDTNWLLARLRDELGDMYADSLWADMTENIRLYTLYDGTGQKWEVAKDLDYTPAQKITNHIKYLIKEGARFMMSRAPEITIQPVGKEDANTKLCEALETWLRQVLEGNGWQAMLPKAHRDCAIGKRVALKLHGESRGTLRIRFRPSLEFFHDIEEEDATRLKKVIFYYHKTVSDEAKDQRTFFQLMTMNGGKCEVTEGTYDGNGTLVQGDGKPQDTLLDEIPVYVILNDGLTGDVIGESDAKEMEDDALAFNRLTSDDLDALKFNMFPQRIFTDASEDSLAKAKVSPGAQVDLQTDATAMDRQAQYGMLESKFSYDARFEHTVDRIVHSLHKIMDVPEVSIDDLKALGISGKAMKALYWALISRCEEKWAVWDTAIKWMVRMLVKMAKAYGIADHTKAVYTIGVEHLYPIPDDEEDERTLDMQEVKNRVRSRKSYIEKWQPTADADAEIEQMAAEARMAEEGY